MACGQKRELVGELDCPWWSIPAWAKGYSGAILRNSRNGSDGNFMNCRRVTPLVLFVSHKQSRITDEFIRIMSKMVWERTPEEIYYVSLCDCGVDLND